MNDASVQPAQPPPRKLSGRQWPGPSAWVAAAVLLAAAVVLCWVPLFNLLGYEFSAALSVLVSLLAGPLAAGVARRRPAAYRAGTTATGAVAPLAARAALYNLAALVLPLAVISLNALRVTNCSFGQGMLFYLLLPVATALVWTGPGLLWGLLLPWRGTAGLACVLTWLAVAAVNGWEFYSGPGLDSYNQIAGWIAGPIMQEVVRPNLALLGSRLHGLLWSATAWLAAAALFDPVMNRCRLGVVWRQRRLLLALSICLATAGFGWWLGDRLGYRRSLAAVSRQLAATRQTQHFVIHHDPALAGEALELLAADHEFRLQQILRRLELAPQGRLHSWVFRSARQKLSLTGAGRVQFAKPWQRAIYINQAGFPHPVLRHELVHAVAARFGSWPLRTSSRWLLWQNPGLIEGLAVALDWPLEPADPHRLSAAMRRTGLATEPESLFDPVGFWTHPARRAYLQAGSVVRFLLDGWGPLPLMRAYRRGSLQGCFPRPAAKLLRRWERFVDGLELGELELQASRLRLGRPGLFERTCAHELADLAGSTRQALAAGRLDEAAALLERWRHWQADALDLGRAEIELEVRRQRYAEALAVADRLLEREELTPAQRAQLQGRRADVAWRLGREEAARSGWQALLAARLDAGHERLALAKLEALRHGAAGQRVLRFLVTGKPELGWVLELREAAAQQPDWALPWYLVGRQLYNRGDHARAVDYLRRALAAGLVHPALSGEALRLLVRSAFLLGRRKEAALLLGALSALPARPADPAWAADWLERLVFAQSSGDGAPRRPPGKTSPGSAR